ncbi:unnamed protein product [Absidia cylindrospora]
MYIGSSSAARLFIDMENSLPTIPTTFDGSFRSPFGRHTSRAVDYIDLVLYVIPAIFVRHFKNLQTRVSVLSIVHFMQIALQWSVSRPQQEQMESLLETWNNYLLNQVEENKLPVNVFTPNQHYLQHLPDMIAQLGPPVMYSARPIEGTIGRYENRLKSRADVGGGSKERHGETCCN